MTTDIAIVLIVFVLFIVLILTGIAKIHVAAMMIPIALEITGVLEFKDAWGGMLNSSVVMMGSMFVVSAAINKTSYISRMSKALIKPGSSDFKIMCGLAVPVLLLGCFINAATLIPLMLPMISAICAEQKRPLSKFVYPVAILAQLWAGFIPTGGNAGTYLANNTIVENLGGTGTWGYFTIMTAKIPLMIVMIPLILWLSVKIAPDNGNIPTMEDTAKAAALAASKKKKDAGTLSPTQEKIVVAVFAIMVIGIVACALTGNSTWWPSVVAALVLIFSGILTDRDAMRAVANPVIFITIGTLPLATALKTTGADVLLADLFNQATGNMSPVMTMVLMYLVCCILTQFVSNSAVSNAFKTLAALISVQNGYDARALMLSAQEGSSNCYLFPAAAPGMTLAYESGGYSLKQHFKQGILFTLVRFIIFVLYVPLVYPLV